MLWGDLMIYLAVVGGANCSAQEKELAYTVGMETALKGGVVVCGGGSGVMEAASAGAVENGGAVLGILPGENHHTGNPYLTYSIATGLGEARNAIIARTAHALIAVGGEFGTLSEIALALKMGKPVIGLQTWQLNPPRPVTGGIIYASTAKEAVRLAYHHAARS